MWLLNIVPIEMSILALLMYHHYYVLEKLEEIKNQEIKVNIYNENEKKLILEKKEKIYSWNEEEK